MSALTRSLDAQKSEIPWGISAVEPPAQNPCDHELRRLLDAAHDGFALVKDGDVVWGNRALHRMVDGLEGEWKTT